MAAEIKSIDKHHLLEIGLEGFYGESMPDRKQINPGYEVGTDFISNNNINGVDFATIHLYPDQWYRLFLNYHVNSNTSLFINLSCIQLETHTTSQLQYLAIAIAFLSHFI